MITHVLDDAFDLSNGFVSFVLVFRQYLFRFVVDADKILQLFFINSRNTHEHGEIVALMIDALRLFAGAGEEGFIVAILEGRPVSVKEEAALWHAHCATVYTGGDPFPTGIQLGLESVWHDEAILIAGIEYGRMQRPGHHQLAVAMEALQYIILHAGKELYQVRHFNAAGVQAQVLPQVVICKGRNACGIVHAQINGNPIRLLMVERAEYPLTGCHGFLRHGNPPSGLCVHKQLLRRQRQNEASVLRSKTQTLGSVRTSQTMQGMQKRDFQHLKPFAQQCVIWFLLKLRQGQQAAQQLRKGRITIAQRNVSEALAVAINACAQVVPVAFGSFQAGQNLGHQRQHIRMLRMGQSIDEVDDLGHQAVVRQHLPVIDRIRTAGEIVDSIQHAVISAMISSVPSWA